ncbi:hypothetical protein GOC38_17885 [Sinorhizobium meliloti]|nr:hypothetical protein [Sinorhizobium meliloti]MDX0325989.1 hypothetical protein [Sinorhizobium meliloti]
MIITIQVLEFMESTPIVGAHVAVELDVIARWSGEEERWSGGGDSGEDKRWSDDEKLPPEVETPSGQPLMSHSLSVQQFEALGTTTADGTCQVRFDDVANAIARAQGETWQGQAPDDVGVFGRFRVVLAGSGWQFGLNTVWTSRAGSQPASPGPGDDVWRIAPVDFATAIVGDTTPDSALLWFKWNGDVSPHEDRCVCDITPMPSVAQEPVSPKKPGGLEPALRPWPVPIRSIPVVFGAETVGANIAVVRVQDLRAGTRYRYSLRLKEAGEAGASDSWRDVASGEFMTALSATDRLRFIFSSCHKPAAVPGSLTCWQMLAARRDYDLMLLIGDQIYEDYVDDGIRNDASWEAWYRRYASQYDNFWVYRPMREVLRRTPTFMIFDDHDVRDDWGSRRLDAQDKPWVTTPRLRGALEAYLDYQQAHNPGGRQSAFRGWEGPFHYPFRRGPAAIFMLDVRSKRTGQGNHPILGEEQFHELRAWARGEAREADVVFLVTPVPIAYLPVQEVKRLLKELKDKGGEWGSRFIAKSVWSEVKLAAPVVPGLVAVAVAAGYVLGRWGGRRTVQQKVEANELGDHYGKDFADMWTCGSKEIQNQPDLVAVLDLLFDLANDVQDDGTLGPRPRAVFVLSGDVHIGAMHVIHSQHDRHSRNPNIYQLTSSGISNPSTDEVMRAVVEHIKPGAHIHEADIGAFAIKDDFAGLALHIFGPDLAEFYLDDQPRSDGQAHEKYRARLLHKILAERNFGRVAVETVDKEKREYRFHFSIQGQGRLLSRSMKLILNEAGVEEKVEDAVEGELVKGLIREKWVEVGSEGGFLGYPLTDETPASDGIGRFNYFEGGSIYWHPDTGAHEVRGLIRDRWEELGSERSHLGYPLTDETPTSDGVGRFNHFERGSIYWHPDTGAHEVRGLIRDRWAELGSERSHLGYPMTDETPASDGVGRFNHFERGSIYWHPDTGAHEVRGLIKAKWAELGSERSALGYPTTDELMAPDGNGRVSHFERGSIYWRPDTGAREVYK